MSKITKISYETLLADMSILAQRIAKSNLKDIELVCISRGGLFVGGMLSYLLDIKKVHCVCLESYNSDNSNKGKDVTALLPFPNLDPKTTYLFVDDVNDTSKTFQYITNTCNSLGVSFLFATVYHKARSNNLMPDYFGKELPADAWIEFPWDTAVEKFQLSLVSNTQDSLLELGLESSDKESSQAYAIAKANYIIEQSRSIRNSINDPTWIEELAERVAADLSDDLWEGQGR